MSDPKVYDSNLVHVTLADRPIASGRAEAEFVSTDYSAETFSKTVGADGEVTISRTNNKSGEIKIKLTQTSDGHKLLTQLYAIQRDTPGGVLMDFEVRDILGGLVESAAKCWFTKPPASPYGATAAEREWTLGCAELIREVA